MHKHTHTLFSHNFKELRGSMNPRREPPNERKSYAFCAFNKNKIINHLLILIFLLPYFSIFRLLC